MVTMPGGTYRGAHEGLCEVLMQPYLRAMLED